MGLGEKVWESVGEVLGEILKEAECVPWIVLEAVMDIDEV